MAGDGQGAHKDGNQQLSGNTVLLQIPFQVFSTGAENLAGGYKWGIPKDKAYIFRTRRNPV